MIAQFDIPVKSKVDSLDVDDLEKAPNLNPVSHWGYLTLSKPSSHHVEYFQDLDP